MNSLINDIKKELHANMNGVASAHARQTEDYRVNWGVELPRAGLARQQSAAARQLTDAVTLAGNAAEAVSVSADPAELLALLNENGNAEELPDASGVRACYNDEKNPDPQGAFCVEVSWQPEKTARGTMVSSVIQVRHGASEKPVYSLETASFREEGAS